MGFNVGDVVYLYKHPESFMTVSMVLSKEQLQYIGFPDDANIVYCSLFYGLTHFSAFYETKLLMKTFNDNSRPELKIGDIVCLKSHPEVQMKVSLLLTEQMLKFGLIEGDVQCTWFNGKDYSKQFFMAEMLEKKSNLSTN